MSSRKYKKIAILATIAAVIFLAAFVVLLFYKTDPENINRRQEASASTETSAAVTTESSESSTSPESSEEEEETEPEASQETTGAETESTTEETSSPMEVEENEANGENYEEGAARYAVMAWENMLSQLDYDADVVFFGDSITQRVDFQSYYPDQKIVNLGLGGDNISGMTLRVSMLSKVNPEKIFIMCGINCLHGDNIDECIAGYSDLLDKTMEAVPDAKIYVQSILPVSGEMQTARELTLSDIEDFNKKLSDLAWEKGIVYVDLYPQFLLDGQINPDLTVDGVHLSDEGSKLWMWIIAQYMNN